MDKNNLTKSEVYSNKLRWFMLILISLVISVNYYVYDAMSAIKSVMQQELGLSSIDYGLIVSFYSFPNTFLLMSIFGGIILDKWGIRRTGFLFVLFCALGSLLTAYGASSFYNDGGLDYVFFNSFMSSYSPELKMMILGRLLFGLGAETSIIVANKIIVKWFKGKEMAFAFAVFLAIARLGTAAALMMSPVLVSHESGWTTALWVAAILMITGLLLFIIYMAFDKKFDDKLEKVRLLSPEEEFKLQDVLNLFTNKAFIYICLLCVTFYSAVFPFQAYCPDLLHNKFGLSISLSGTLSSIIIWGTIVFTPLFGIFVDKKGKRATLMIYGSVLLIAVHLILSLTNLTPYVPMVILGIAFSLVPAALWPAVPYIVKESMIGTAYGVMASIQNLGLFAFPILAGYILDESNSSILPSILKGEAVYDYSWTIIMFAGLGFVGLLFAILLKRQDKIDNLNLEKPEINSNN